ncbi:MAG TPA: 4'-phosphopantetheinyl transferase superfamily protein [Candidatus Fimivicinus intestinavium]|nr:4'-phosphopantetheinyl transferase superfamily protein [Candidatus Fimivicinus intestinavium]
MRIMSVHLPQGIPAEVFAHWLALLPPERRSDLLSRRAASVRDRSLCGEILARAMLAQTLRCPPGAISISRGAHGKPELCGAPNLFFNISHSGHYAVCAVSDRPVGIDIEQQRAYRPQLAGRVCSEAEQSLLAQSRDPSQLFCRLWTLKESFVKCTGAGLGAHLNKISFSFSPDGTVRSNQEGFYFTCRNFADGYWLAVCQARRQ